MPSLQPVAGRAPPAPDELDDEDEDDEEDEVDDDDDEVEGTPPAPPFADEAEEPCDAEAPPPPAPGAPCGAPSSVRAPQPMASASAHVGASVQRVRCHARLDICSPRLSHRGVTNQKP